MHFTKHFFITITVVVLAILVIPTTAFRESYRFKLIRMDLIAMAEDYKANINSIKNEPLLQSIEGLVNRYCIFYNSKNGVIQKNYYKAKFEAVVTAMFPVPQ
ncbi:uncharacterized protein LOC132931049 [Rhopalosiphum padi]|uniref:uncharacterized protein LOC132931045 n=1 Tax=Rhopalosiphum padi TaxID=40932 RepID=UPI00298E6B46|nr:uncharacterized protein LOC132931045 [Rhopalosiphum padi]XP_060853229.1 uncharacterized protein LOC132931049 [Rhopalosiphum padi]